MPLSQRPPRDLVVLSLVAMVVLLPLGITAQPTWDLRDDLVSGLAARGADLPWLGRGVMLALALAHVGAAMVLLRRHPPARLAAAAAGLAALGVVGVALVPITCPRGASGCSGPDSGRRRPPPLQDVVHRDLVVVVETGSLLLSVLVTLLLLQERRRVLAAITAAATLASPVLLALQQQGQDIGVYQLTWLAALCAPLLVLALAPPPDRS